MPQHDALSLERWTRFTLDQQILMIANEMHRASKLLGPSDGDRRRNAYERVLALTDLTIRANGRRALRRELLRWRDLAARLYVDAIGAPAGHAAALRALLRFTPEASRQIPHLTPPTETPCP
jgi:hypothetical protein